VTRSGRSRAQGEWETPSKQDIEWLVSHLGLCSNQADSHRSTDSRRCPHWVSERMPRRRQSMRQYHLATADGLTPIRCVLILPSERPAAPLKKRGDHFGGNANAQGHALGSIGGCQASSARSGALEDIGWTATRNDDAGYFAKLATARASLS